jgi:hypothetical protein
VDDLPIELLPDDDPPALEPLEAAKAGAAASINAETATAILIVFIGSSKCEPPPSGGGQEDYVRRRVRFLSATPRVERGPFSLFSGVPLYA